MGDEFCNVGRKKRNRRQDNNAVPEWQSFMEDKCHKRHPGKMESKSRVEGREAGNNRLRSKRRGARVGMRALG